MKVVITTKESISPQQIDGDRFNGRENCGKTGNSWTEGGHPQ
jgi:hypothetical protein